MNIGIYGGTFNPPHIGHLVTAECVRDTIGLDEIIFVPSYISPHKQEGEEQVALHRFEMTKLAVKGSPNFGTTEYEINKKEPSYSISTVEYFKTKYKGSVLYLIIGMDNYLTFHLWKEPERILELATLVVMNRPNYPQKVNEVIGTKNTIFVEVPNVDISSSDVRSHVKAGKSIRYLVPPEVDTYIRKHTLYK